MLANMGSGSGARHLLWGSRMLANRGLDLVPGTCCGAVGCSHTGVGIGARHLLWGGRVLANRGLDLVPGTCCGAAGC